MGGIDASLWIPPPVQLTAEANMKNGMKQLRRAHFSCEA